MNKYLLILILCFSLFSCNDKKENTSENLNNDKLDETILDTNLTPQEVFSSTLVEDVLQNGIDEDLEIYLEEEIYPIISKSNKVTIDRLSSSLYLLTYEEGGNLKNLLIQKFYNPVSDEMIFEKKETDLTAIRQFLK